MVITLNNLHQFTSIYQFNASFYCQWARSLQMLRLTSKYNYAADQMAKGGTNEISNENLGKCCQRCYLRVDGAGCRLHLYIWAVSARKLFARPVHGLLRKEVEARSNGRIDVQNFFRQHARTEQEMYDQMATGIIQGRAVVSSPTQIRSSISICCRF